MGTQSSDTLGGLALGLLWFSSGKGKGRSSVRIFTLRTWETRWFSTRLLVAEVPFRLRGCASGGVLLSMSLPLPSLEWRSVSAGSDGDLVTPVPRARHRSSPAQGEAHMGSLFPRSESVPGHSWDVTASEGSLLRAPFFSLEAAPCSRNSDPQPPLAPG